MPDMIMLKDTKTNEKNSVKSSLSDNKIGLHRLFMFLSFFVPFEMMLMVFARNIIYPFGDQTFLKSDLYQQYMPFFQEFVRKLKSGEGLAYTWNVGLGSNFEALYGYYLASPLHFLAILFPASMSIEFLSYLVLVKVGLAGFTAFMYFKSREHFDGINQDFSALIISCLYAMSGYVAAYSINIMWLDGIILAPIIILGLERLVRYGKINVYVISLAICIFSNFYIAILVCIFIILYFFYMIFTESFNKTIVWRFIVGSLLAGGLASVILVPEMFALWNADFEKYGFPKTWTSYFSIFEIISRHCFGLSTDIIDGKWPYIFCGSAFFLLIPLYVMNTKIPLKKKIGMLILAGIFLLSFETNALEYIWHGMRYPRGFPARQAFLYILIILSICHDCIVHIDGVSKEIILKGYSIALITLLLIEHFIKNSTTHTWDWLKTLFFVTIYKLFIYLYKRGCSEKRKEWLAILSYLLVVTECTINMSACMTTMDRNEYLNHLNDYKVLYERNKNVESFQRFENADRNIENDSAAAGFASASAFSSVLNDNVKRLYKKMGLLTNQVYTKYNGATALVSALLNVGYMFSDDEEYENTMFHMVDQEHGVYLFEANYSLPFGYVAPKGYDILLDSEDDPITAQNKLLTDLGIHEELLYKEDAILDETSLKFTAEKDGVYYGLVEDSDISNVDIYFTNKKKASFYVRNGIVVLGSMKTGDNATLSCKDKKKELVESTISIYRMDVEVLEQAIQKLGNNHLTRVNIDNTDVSGHLDLSEAGRLIMSVPYERGWSVYVNGKKTEPEKFGGAFIALDLEPGSYDIVMHYSPAGSKLGLYFSLISLLLFVSIEVFSGRKNKKVVME